MAARAHEISLEAGSKMAAAMKDVINAAAGLTAFAMESARELVQYMVRRGQMTQDEADKLMRDVEHAHGTRPDSKGREAKAKAMMQSVAKERAPKAAAPPAAKVEKAAAPPPAKVEKAAAPPPAKVERAAAPPPAKVERAAPPAAKQEKAAKPVAKAAAPSAKPKAKAAPKAAVKKTVKKR
jgi:polyhydroxyalkanoate synthesis regulator phasin